MRRILLLGAAALLFAPPALWANAPFRPPFPPQPPGQPPAQQVQKMKLNIEIDEKATEPRLLVPQQALMGGFNFGGAFGVQGAAGAFGAIGAAGNLGAGGAAGFGGALGAGGAPPGNFGVLGGPPPGAAGQKGGPPPGAAGQKGGQPPVPPGGVFPPGGGDEEQPAAEPAQDNRRGSLPMSTIIVGLALTLSLSTGGLWMIRRKGGALGGAAPLGVFVAVLSIALLSGAAVWANLAPPFQRPPAQKPPVRPVQPQLPGPLPALMKLEGVKVEMYQGDTIRLILTKKHKENFNTKDSKKEKTEKTDE